MKDFDHWFNKMSKLAKENPKKFEEERQKLIDEIIENSNNSEQLKKLQWKINMERKRCKTPLQATIKISDMMWKKFYDQKNGFIVAVNRLQKLAQSLVIKDSKLLNKVSQNGFESRSDLEEKNNVIDLSKFRRI